ncbi:MAG TPA: hypothetical protein VGH65_09355 [Verrucomicrobiaceae bacterium]
MEQALKRQAQLKKRRVAGSKSTKKKNVPAKAVEAPVRASTKSKLKAKAKPKSQKAVPASKPAARKPSAPKRAKTAKEAKPAASSVEKSRVSTATADGDFLTGDESESSEDSVFVSQEDREA